MAWDVDSCHEVIWEVLGVSRGTFILHLLESLFRGARSWVILLLCKTSCTERRGATDEKEKRTVITRSVEVDTAPWPDKPAGRVSRAIWRGIAVVRH